MSRNTPKTEVAFSQPGPLCCPMNTGEPPRAHRILGHRAHPSITQTVLHSQAITKLYNPTSQHQATVHLLPCMTSPSSQLPLEFQLSVDHILMLLKESFGEAQPSLPQIQKTVCSGLISAYVRSVSVLLHKHPPSQS